MRISSRGRYALRMMLDVARHGARLVRGVAGRYGGYRIARPLEEITIGQIIEAAIGPVCVVDCVEDPESCPRAEYCECRPVYDLVNQRIREVLHEFTLADLIRRRESASERDGLPLAQLVGAGSEFE